MRQVKQSGWYCFLIASTVGSCGPSALWQKAQMSARSRESSQELCASVSLSGDEPMHSWVSLTSGAVPPRVPIHILPLPLACLLLGKCGWLHFSREGGRGLASGEGQSHVSYTLQVGKLRHWGDCTLFSSPGGWQVLQGPVAAVPDPVAP